MNLFQLRAFDAVAREGSFTRAAERLCISQPAVTGHVKALEEHYQVTLFRRTARRIELTEEGSRLVAITRTLFALEEEAEALLDANRQLVSGRLEVAADGPHLVMPMLARLRASYPGITVNLRLGNAQETLAALLSEHVDVAVQLDQQIMVLREPGSITRRTFDRACAEQGVQPRVLLELDSREAVTEAVAAELGVGVVSSLEVGNDPRVRAVPLVGPELTNRHLIGCLEKRRGLRVIRAFLELAAA